MLRVSQTDVVREICRRSLAEFVKRAWHVIEPSTPLVWNWHMDAVCDHLMAVTDGRIRRLLINIPPGTSKSTLVNVFWPAWEWGAAGLPHYKIISASHAQDLATRDSRKMRNLISSEWYQAHWPTDIVSDQNQKTYYENGNTGFRQASAVTSMTGKRGDRVLWDDPHSIEDALSPAKRETATRVFKETLPTRLISPEHSAIVIVMQRIHEDDVSGLILANDYGYEHLCLPMEYEPERKCVTSIGFEDPRADAGELLMPERFPRHVVEADKRVMGSYAVAGQFQQRPAPRGGGLFQVDKLEYIDKAPECVEVCRYWDKAATQDGGDYTAGVKVGRTKDDRYVILDVVHGQWSPKNRDVEILAAANRDGKSVKIKIEKEGGSAGLDSFQAAARMLAGFKVEGERPTGSKEARADAAASQVEAGNVMILRGSWNDKFVDELKVFPNGKHDDQVDAFAGAFNKVALNQKEAGIIIF